MDHIVLNVSDIERSLAFYTEILGLKGERIDEFRGGRVGFPSVRISETCLTDLMPQDGSASGESRTNLGHFCLVADDMDFENLARDLARVGVAVLRGPVSRWGARGDAKSVYIQDPDENEIEIRSYRSNSL